MPFEVDVQIWFRDADEKEGYESVRLKQELLDDFTNMDDVMSDVDDINTAVLELSAAQVTKQVIAINVPRTNAAPNEFADLATYAFIRLQDATNLDPNFVRIPAPDMALYDASQDGLLDPQFQTDFAPILALIESPETGNDLDYEYAQKRTRKRFKKLA